MAKRDIDAASRLVSASRPPGFGERSVLRAAQTIRHALVSLRLAATRLKPSLLVCALLACGDDASHAGADDCDGDGECLTSGADWPPPCPVGTHREGGAARASACVPDEPCTPDACAYGSCDDSTGEIVCTCDPGWAGERCDGCADGFVLDGAGACVSPGDAHPVDPDPEPPTADDGVEFAEPCTDGSDCAHEVPMTGYASPLFREVDIAMRQFVKFRCVGALTLAVARNGRRVYKRGFGRMEGRATVEPMPGCGTNANDVYVDDAGYVQPDTPMILGSVSKFVTATMARELVTEAFGPDPTARKLTEPGLLRDDIRGLFAGETCSPIHVYDLDPCARACADAGADIRWQDVTLGDLIAHSAGLPPSAPSWSTWVVPAIAALRGLTDAPDFQVQEDALVAEWGAAKVDAARDAIADRLALGAGEHVYFVPHYDQLGGQLPIDEELAAIAGRCLAAAPQGQTDASPAASTGYSNTGAGLLESVITNLHPSGRYSARVGRPDEHVGSALDTFLEGEGIDRGVESDEGLVRVQWAAIPGYTLPTPVPRQWNGTNYRGTDTGDEKRTFCVWDGEACDFAPYLAGELDGVNVRPPWYWSNGALQLETVRFWQASEAIAIGTGSLAGEMPLLLRLVQRYAIGGSTDVRMGRRRSTCGPTCVDDIMIKNGVVGSHARAYVASLNAGTGPTTQTVGTLPPLDENGRFVGSSSPYASAYEIVEPTEVDFAVAIDGDDGIKFAGPNDMIDEFVRYALARVDWAGVDRMLDNQSRRLVGIALDPGGDTHYWYEDEVHAVRPGDPLAHVGADGVIAAEPYRLPSTRIGPDVVALDISPDGTVLAWYSDGRVGTGDDEDLSRSAPVDFGTPPGKSWRDVAAVAVSSDDVTYAWYRDGTRSWGTTTDLDAYGSSTFALPPAPDQSVDDIADVALASAADDAAWTVFRDGAVAKGWAGDLDAHAYQPGRVTEIGMDVWGDTWIWYASGYYRVLDGSLADNLERFAVIASGDYHMPAGESGFTVTGADFAPAPFVGQAAIGLYASAVGTAGAGDALDAASSFAPVYPAGQSASTLVGLAFAGDGTAHAWFADGTLARGTSLDLAAYALGEFVLPPGRTGATVRGIAIDWAVDDRVWVLYDDGSVSAGEPDDLDAHGYWPRR